MKLDDKIEIADLPLSYSKRVLLATIIPNILFWPAATVAFFAYGGINYIPKIPSMDGPGGGGGEPFIIVGILVVVILELLAFVFLLLLPVLGLTLIAANVNCNRWYHSLLAGLVGVVGGILPVVCICLYLRFT